MARTHFSFRSQTDYVIRHKFVTDFRHTTASSDKDICWQVKSVSVIVSAHLTFELVEGYLSPSRYWILIRRPIIRYRWTQPTSLYFFLQDSTFGMSDHTIMTWFCWSQPPTGHERNDLGLDLAFGLIDNITERTAILAARVQHPKVAHYSDRTLQCSIRLLHIHRTCTSKSGQNSSNTTIKIAAYGVCTKCTFR